MAKVAQADIAIVAQEPANGARGMAMIDMKAAFASRRIRLADCALAVLRLKHLGVGAIGESVAGFVAVVARAVLVLGSPLSGSGGILFPVRLGVVARMFLTAVAARRLKLVVGRPVSVELRRGFELLARATVLEYGSVRRSSRHNYFPFWLNQNFITP